MRITMLAAGTRGDVQPYVALGVGLQRAGHHVCIPAPEIFCKLIVEAGLDFKPIKLERGGREIQSPLELLGQPEMQAMMSKVSGPFGMLAVLRILQLHMADFIDAYYGAYWDASEDADLLVVSTMSFGGLDFAEKRGIVCIQAPIQPLTPTRAFPAPLLAPYGIRLNNALNPLTYHILRLGMWRLLRAPVNNWRREMGLSPHSGSDYWRRTQAQTTVYGFSPSVLPAPTDWPPNHHVTGYWFLDEPTDWQPLAGLVQFLKSGPPPVYVGFGSMPADDPMRMVSVVVEALRISGQRGILLSGWGGLGSSIPLPETVYSLETIPHSWLFPKMAAVVHHGGMGTTAAGLRAGVPPVIVPVGADQVFWAKRVEQLGVGVQCASYFKFSADQLATALHKVTTDTDLCRRAAALGERIRAENGVERAVAAIQDCTSHSKYVGSPAARGNEIQ